MGFGLKIIFLDFDGVLNSQKYFISNNDNLKEFLACNKNSINSLDTKVERQMLDIDIKNLANLVKLVRSTNAKVVVTSSWKILEVFPRIITRLGKLGVPIIGVTEDNGINRGLGIRDYLEKHNIKNYIILDDDIFPDYDDELLDHLIKTSFYEDGLNDDLTNLAIEKLNNKSFVKRKKKY